MTAAHTRANGSKKPLPSGHASARSQETWNAARRLALSRAVLTSLAAQRVAASPRWATRRAGSAPLIGFNAPSNRSIAVKRVARSDMGSQLKCHEKVIKGMALSSSFAESPHWMTRAQVGRCLGLRGGPSSALWLVRRQYHSADRGGPLTADCLRWFRLSWCFL